MPIERQMIKPDLLVLYLQNEISLEEIDQARHWLESQRRRLGEAEVLNVIVTDKDYKRSVSFRDFVRTFSPRVSNVNWEFMVEDQSLDLYLNVMVRAENSKFLNWSQSKMELTTSERSMFRMALHTELIKVPI